MAPTPAEGEDYRLGLFGDVSWRAGARRVGRILSCRREISRVPVWLFPNGTVLVPAVRVTLYLLEWVSSRLPQRGGWQGWPGTRWAENTHTARTVRHSASHGSHLQTVCPELGLLVMSFMVVISRMIQSPPLRVSEPLSDKSCHRRCRCRQGGLRASRGATRRYCTVWHD